MRIKSFQGFRGCLAAGLRPRENARHFRVHGRDKSPGGYRFDIAFGFFIFGKKE
ncbi:hypothetical protein B4168_3147 [Anoxybacillus flavithermus]|nr:hypothetical protein B4168_3147 [Anoxybacillus flavithermus]OAO86434.1 hypothetical protein GT23_2327 [Parageobacillus thermoglucosidasius]